MKSVVGAGVVFLEPRLLVSILCWSDGSACGGGEPMFRTVDGGRDSGRFINSLLVDWMLCDNKGTVRGPSDSGRCLHPLLLATLSSHVELSSDWFLHSLLMGWMSFGKKGTVRGNSDSGRCLHPPLATLSSHMELSSDPSLPANDSVPP